MNKKAKSVGTFAFFICLIVVVGMMMYYRYMNRQRTEQTEKLPSTEVEKLLAKDMDGGYPETPKEVVGLYSRMIQCLYKDGMSDEEFDKILEKVRLMYTSELLNNNSFENQKQKLQEEIKSFESDKRSILSYTVESSAGKYKTIKNRECTVVQVAFFLRKGNEYTKAYEEFMLTKEENKWKILGFRQLQGEQTAIEDGGEDE